MSSSIPDSEAVLTRAVQDIKKSSIRSVAKSEGVPYSKLRGRIKGTQPTQIAHEKFLSLTRIQEQELIDFIIIREKGRQPLTKQEIHQYAEHLAELNDWGPHLGKRWVDRFFSRHTSIILKPSRLISAARKQLVTEEKSQRLLPRPWNYHT